MAFRARRSTLLQARTATWAAISIFLCNAALYGIDKAITIALVYDGLTQGDREPLRAYLTKAMGQPVNLVAPDLYNETVAHLTDRSYDFACLGALMYVGLMRSMESSRWSGVVLICTIIRSSSPVPAPRFIRSAT